MNGLTVEEEIEDYSSSKGRDDRDERLKMRQMVVFRITVVKMTTSTPRDGSKS